MKRVRVKITLISLMIITLVISSSGCSLLYNFNLFNQDNNRVSGEIGENSNLNMYDLVQKLADSIRNENEIENIYNSIPLRQRNGLTLDQYQQYIRLLKRGVTGDITSFSLMSEKETQQEQERMLKRLPDKQDLILSVKGAWLFFREIGRSETKFAVYITKNADGVYTLGSQWALDILALYDLTRLYFDAIDRSDLEALSVLIKTDDRPADILAAKAERIIGFYHNNISSRTSEFLLTNASIDSISFEQFGITNPDQTQSVSRNIEIISTSGQGYIIDDVIPDIVNLLDLDIYFNEHLIIQFAAMEEDEPVIVRSNNLESIIGEPLVHDETNCVNLVGGNQRMTLEYENLELVAEGTCFRHSRWEGQIKKLILNDELTTLGSGISPGDMIYDVLRQYTFADETGYIVSRRVDSGTIRMQFLIEDDTVQLIEIILSAN